RFRGSVRAGDDRIGRSVDGNELVGARGGGESATAVSGEVEFERRGANRDFVELVRAGIQDEHVAAGVADAPDFGAARMFAKVRDAGGSGNLVDGAKRGEVYNSEGAVGRGDVSVEMEIGAEERGAVFAKKDDQREHGEEH